MISKVYFIFYKSNNIATKILLFSKAHNVLYQLNSKVLIHN